MSYITSVGRRKTSVARIYLKAGSGKMSINNRDLETYFPQPTMQKIVQQPFALTETEGQFDIKVNVFGGGIKGQAEGIRLGIARALLKVNEEHRVAMKPEGILTRDPRMVERKKPGQKKARKSFQFSKR